MGLERLGFVLQDAVEQARAAVGVEELLGTRFGIIPTKVIGEREEERIDGEGGDELVEVSGRVRLCVRRPREIERGRVARRRPGTDEQAATSLRVLQVAQEGRSALDVDGLAAEERVLVPRDVREVEVERPVPRGVDANRQDPFKVGDESRGDQLGHLDVGAFSDLYLDGQVDDFLCVDVARGEASGFDCEDPEVAKGLQVRLVVGRDRGKAGKEGRNETGDRRIGGAEGVPARAEEEKAEGGVGGRVGAVPHRLVVHSERISKPPKTVDLSRSGHDDVQRNRDKVQSVADRVSLDLVVVRRSWFAMSVSCPNAHHERLSLPLVYASRLNVS